LGISKITGVAVKLAGDAVDHDEITIELGPLCRIDLRDQTRKNQFDGFERFTYVRHRLFDLAGCLLEILR
jgi:hypothetical protein